METTKISFSANELGLMENSEWILTKNGVIDKVALGLGDLAAQLQRLVAGKADRLPPEVFHASPKISRGEKYKGLPYLILDYPRQFEREQVLAIRTLFWWGHYCSVTLHLKGKYMNGVLERIYPEADASKTMYVSLSGDEWNHDLAGGNYQPVSDVSSNSPGWLPNPAFVKLTCKTELKQWNQMEEELLGSYKALLRLLER